MKYEVALPAFLRAVGLGIVVAAVVASASWGLLGIFSGSFLVAASLAGITFLMA